MQTLSTPLRAALDALLEIGRSLRARIATALTLKAPLPRPFRRAPATAETRIATALEWLAALARTLAGDPFFLPLYRLPAYPRFPGRYPALTNAIRVSCGLPPNPPSTPAQRAARRLRHMREVFATQATGIIAARLARRLGLTPADTAWPTDLVALPETPATLNRRAWATNPTPPSPPTATSQPPTPSAPSQPIAPHKRE